VIPYFNPITPLVINAGTVDKVFAAIERGLPIIYSNYGMLGTSTPITLAGTLALLTAELLAGLTLAQCIRPGAPVILGSLPALFHMRDMVSYYGPWTMLLNLACAEMMAHYGIPHCGTSGSTGGYGADPQAAAEQMINQATATLGRAGLAPFVGSVLGGKVFDPLNAVLADEIIGWALRFWEGFSWEEKFFALEEIEEVGPGGTFLGTERTLCSCRATMDPQALFTPLSLERWREMGSPTMTAHLRERTLDLLDTLQPPEDSQDLLARGEAWIAAATGT
jgi:trimethylamine--corrinoid protein Co-methyltransferase